MKSIVSALSMALAVCLALAAHGAKPPSAAEVEKAARAFRAEKGRRGGELRLPIMGVPRTMNPLISAGSSPTIHRHLYSALIEHDPIDNRPLPALAESLPRRLDDEGRRWEITLRDGLRWSDGEPLTAADVVFTIDTAVNTPDIPTRFRHHWQPLGGVDLPADGRLVRAEAVDRRIVRFETLVPWGWMAESLAATPILPRHALEPAAEAGAFAEPIWPNEAAINMLVGSGPFRLESIDAQRGIVLTRNPHYFREDAHGARLPYLDTLVYVRVQSPAEAQALFLAGELDVVDVPPANIRRMAELADQQGFQLLRGGPSDAALHLVFHLDRRQDENLRHYVEPRLLAWFSDVRFRQAMSLAIDRQAIVREAYGESAWIDGFPERNLAAAERLLDAMGLDKRDAAGMRIDDQGRPVGFILSVNASDRIAETVCGLLAKNFKDAGVQATVTPRTFRDWYVARLRRRDWEAELMHRPTGAPGHPLFLERQLWHSAGFDHVWNPVAIGDEHTHAWEKRINRIVESAREAFDPESHDRLYRDIAGIAQTETILVPLAIGERATAVARRFGNLNPTRHQRFDFRIVFDTALDKAAGVGHD